MDMNGKLHDQIYENFQDIFGSKLQQRIRSSPQAWIPQHRLLEVESEFTEDELKQTIWNLGQDKAPGRDGLPYSSSAALEHHEKRSYEFFFFFFENCRMAK